MRAQKPSLLAGIFFLGAGIWGIWYFFLGVWISLSLAVHPALSDDAFSRHTFLVDILLYGSLTVLAGTLAVHGVNRLRQYVFFGKLRAAMGNRDMVSLEELSRRIPCTVETLRKRIRLFLRRGYFPQGHLNQKFTCFITTDEAYGAYQQTVEAWQKEQEKWQQQGFTEEKRAILQRGEACAERIQARVDTLRDPQLQQELLTLKESVEDLVSVCRQNPGRLASLRTFLNYYLPLAEKLLREYEQLPDYDTGEHLDSLRREIPQGLRTLTEAFESIGQRLCREIEVEIGEDTDLLEALLAKQRMEEGRNE